jgi:hypothetical protein
MLARLEAPENHGAVLVSRALGDLRAARHGLSEDELLDLLSADGEVLEDFRQRSPQSPETEGLPVVVWSRLYFDLQPYLAERSADRTSLLGFYHRQVGEVVAARYLTGEAKQAAHKRLADYFDRQDNRHGAQEGGEYNYRRLAELPYNLNAAAEWGRLAAVLSDWEFTEAKVGAGLTYDLAQDHNAAQRAIPDGALAERAAAALRDWRNFVHSQEHHLLLGDQPFLQVAYNHADGGAVAEEADDRAATIRRDLLAKKIKYIERPVAMLLLKAAFTHGMRSLKTIIASSSLKRTEGFCVRHLPPMTVLQEHLLDPLKTTARLDSKTWAGKDIRLGQ